MSLIKKFINFKNSFFSDYCKDNHVFVIDADGNRREIHRLKHSRIKFKGNNNIIEIHEPDDNLTLHVTVFNNTKIVLNQT